MTASLPDPTRPLVPGRYPPVGDTFARVADSRPDTVAVESGGVSLTYAQLRTWADTIAADLAAAGLRAGDRVAIIGRRGPGAVAAMIAVLRLGSVMVPIDASLPPLRRRQMIEAVSACVVVGDAPPPEADVSTLRIPPVPVGDREPQTPAFPHPEPGDPAYLFFTSGSTGVPKAVEGTHLGLAQFMDWMANEFGIGPDDRVAFTRSLSFDAVLREIFVPLTVGARIVVAPDPFDPDRALEWLARRRITVINATPSHADLWLDVPSGPPTSLRWVFFSGERLDWPLVQRWRKAVRPPGTVVNLYGPTETTFVRCFHRVEDEPGVGPTAVGHPLPGTQIFVVDDEGKLCKPGEKGEVLIRTAYGTRGYVDVDGSDRFIPNPFTGDPHDLVYRTGDIGWYRPDGSLVVSGRTDEQVKILGLRIEPGEVAVALEQHPQVRRAVVVATGDEPPRLVAYVVADGRDPDPADLRRHLEERLPRPAVPSRFVVVAELPLTANGKVDVDALRRGNHPPPTLEERLERLSPAQRALLERRLARHRSDASPRQPGGEPTALRTAPLSPAQERLWFLDRLHPGRSAYNIARAHRLRGPLDVEALRRACDLMVERHEILRTRYVERDGNPIQVVDPPSPATFRIVELGHLDVDSANREVDRLIREESRRGFDLAAGPVWRITLICLSPTEHVLVTVVHHIAADGWSFPLLYRELSSAYDAYTAGTIPRLTDLPIQYADYALRQREKIASGAYQEDLAFWSDLLRDAPDLLPLPADRPRPPIATSTGRRIRFRCPTAPLDGFRRLAREETATGFMVGLALFVALLHRLAGTDHLVVGVPSADRADADTQPLIGFLVNTLALPSTLDADMTFRELLRAVRRRVLQAFDHREVPFEHVVKELSPPRYPDRTPLFQVFYQFGTGAFAAHPDFEGVEAEPIEGETTSSKFDLTMYLATDDEHLSGSVVYNTDLFDAPTIEGFLADFDRLSARLLSRPDSPVAAAPLSLSPRSRRPGPASNPVPAPAPHHIDQAAVDRMCRIWEELLGTDVGPDDDFFALGGHSLLAIRVFSRIEAEWGVHLEVRSIFEDSTPRGLAARLTRAEPAAVTAGGDASSRAPLSFSQRRLWFLDRLDPGAGNYHTPWRVRLRGDLSLPALEAAFADLVARHDVFRTRIVDEGGEPVQIVDPPGPVPVDVVDTTEERLAEALAEEARAPFDLSRDPMIRVKIFRIAPDDQVLSVVAHHIATDAESMSILRRELAELYTAHREGRPPALQPLRTTYREVARRQLERFSSHGEPHLRWWLDLLSGELPVLDLPTDKARPLSGAREGSAVLGDLDDSTTEALIRIAGEEKATPFMVFLAGYAVLLSRYTRQDDLIIGIPATERSSVDTEGLIGFFVNSLPLRIRVQPDDGFRDLVRRVRRTVLDALEHRDVPFEAIVEHLDPPRDPSRTPVFQAMFDMGQRTREPFRLPGTETVPLGVRPRRRPAKFDLRVHVGLRGGHARTLFEYRTDLFDEPTIGDMAAQFERLLASAADSPDLPVADLDMVPDHHRARVPALPAPTGTVPDAFARMVASRPEAPAVVDGDIVVTYRDLDRRADEVARSLAGIGVRPGDTVGVRMPRGIDIVAALVGILRAGAVYVPLDESYPTERIRTIATDAQLAAIIGPGPQVEALDRPERPRLDPGQGPAYVMYTSGSTGRPKGVVVPHRAILRLVTDPDYVGLGPDDVVAFASNTGFDAATFEIWGALLNGAALTVFDRDTLLSPDALAEAIRSRGVTVMFVTTALFNTVVARRGDTFSPLGTLLFGGEAVDIEAVRRCLRSGPPRRLVHVYGPTETTTFATWHLVDSVPDDARTVPIGRPIVGTSVRVVDRRGEDVPPGVPGELVIGGPGVALGYLGDPDLTAARFPRTERGTEYRTGDLVRRRHDGEIEFLGRLDRQVKLRGFRVEPGEIETHLTTHPRVEGAVVVPRRSAGGLRLVAYVAGEVTSEEAAEHLQGRVPPFMMPAAIVPLPRLPLTPNGKVDTSALPEPILPTAPYRPPATDEERKMAGLWEEILEVERVGAADDFFERGGHSLLAIRLFARIEEEFGVTAPLSTLFEAPTLAALTARILGDSHPEAPSSTPPVVTIRPGAEERAPLFCFPPAGGNVMVYEPMARAFEGERPILGIQAKGVDGADQPLRTIEDMAAYCEEAIVATQPAGPYFLTGYSLGGLVAYETARRMRASGRRVGLLALIDARVIPPLDLGSEMRRDLRLIRRYGRRGLRAVGRRMAVRARRLAGRIRHDPKILWYRLTGRPLSPLLAGRRLTAAAIEAAAGYEPSPYPGDVLYLVAAGPSARWRRRAVEPWRQVVGGRLVVAEIPGTHKGPGSIMHEPNARRLAELLGRALREGES